ncbi:MAG: hypothetical protein AAGG44_14840, partial [Planctomycetota bacterium]
MTDNLDSRTTRFEDAVVRLGTASFDVRLGPAGSTACSHLQFVEFSAPFPEDCLTRVAVILTNQNASSIVADATVSRLDGRQGFWLRVSNSIPASSTTSAVEASFDGEVRFNWLAVYASADPIEHSNGADFVVRTGLLAPEPLAKFAWHDWPTYPELFGEAFRNSDIPLLFLTPTHGDGFDGPHGDHVSAVNRAVQHDRSGITHLSTYNADSCPGYAMFYWVAIARCSDRMPSDSIKQDLAINCGVSDVPHQFARTATYHDWQNLHRLYEPAFIEPPHTLVTCSGANVLGHQSNVVSMAFHQDCDCGNLKGRSCDPYPGQAGFHWIA